MLYRLSTPFDISRYNRLSENPNRIKTGKLSRRSHHDRHARHSNPPTSLQRDWAAVDTHIGFMLLITILIPYGGEMLHL